MAVVWNNTVWDYQDFVGKMFSFLNLCAEMDILLGHLHLSWRSMKEFLSSVECKSLYDVFPVLSSWNEPTLKQTGWKWVTSFILNANISRMLRGRKNCSGLATVFVCKVWKTNYYCTLAWIFLISDYCNLVNFVCLLLLIPPTLFLEPLHVKGVMTNNQKCKLILSIVYSCSKWFIWQLVSSACLLESVTTYLHILLAHMNSALAIN